MPEDESTTTPETPAPTAGTGAPAPEATSPEKKYTDADLDRLQAKRAKEATRKALQDVADQLGVSVDEAKKIIEEKRQADEAAKSEIDRAREEAETAKRERDEARAEAAREAFEKRVYRKLSAAGVGAGMEDEAAEKRIAMARRLLDVATDATDEDIVEKITEIKADVPGLFTAKTEGGQPAPSGVTNGRPPASGQTTQSAMERGRERARARRPDPSTATDPFTGPGFRKVG